MTVFLCCKDKILFHLYVHKFYSIEFFLHKINCSFVPLFNIFKEKNMSHLIAASLLSANFSNLQSEIEMINESAADKFHLDIMDGNFVGNISFGFHIIRHIARHAKKPMDFHLMVNNPEKYFQKCKDFGATYVVVHYETCIHLNRTINDIKNLGMKAGVAINPHTPVHLLEDIINDVDLTLVMSVNPGFGGQKFIEHSYKKIKQLKELIQNTNSSSLIEVDGGVNPTNAGKLIASGADILIGGKTIFSSENPKQTILDLKKAR